MVLDTMLRSLGLVWESPKRASDGDSVDGFIGTRLAAGRLVY